VVFFTIIVPYKGGEKTGKSDKMMEEGNQNPNILPLPFEK
jgi:hypothetical protein